MVFLALVAPCFACGALFMCNPNSVPSYDDEPICKTCIAEVNRRREEAGLPLWPVPGDAYVPADEGEL